ncbi:LOW QUALITY PROTEIN: hypothetical protein NC652_028662 [Populus alba x Populus x berolinensis]|nr:LOW QUALITY PROTEIN: hypothetical protein NC652_028662 [Populus alba x Populus x berolinensis]
MYKVPRCGGLGDDTWILISRRLDEDHTAKEDFSEDKQHLYSRPSVEMEQGNQVEGDGLNWEINPFISESPGKQLPPVDSLAAKSKLTPSSRVLTPQYGGRQVAFVSVKRPAPSTASLSSRSKKPNYSNFTYRRS